VIKERAKYGAATLSSLLKISKASAGQTVISWTVDESNIPKGVHKSGSEPFVW